MMRKRFHEEMREVLDRFRHILAEDSEKRKESFSLHALQEMGTTRRSPLDEEPAEDAGEALLPEE
jgi:hypothetical protein